MEKNKINHCLACGLEQQLVGETDFNCERCGTKHFADGGCEYEASEEGIDEMVEQMADYDRLRFNGMIDDDR